MSLQLQAHTSPEKHCSPPRSWPHVALCTTLSVPFLSLRALPEKLPLSGFWSYRHPNKGLPGDSARLQEVLFILSFTLPGTLPKCRNLMTTSDTIVATEHLCGPLAGIHSIKNM